MDHDYILPSPFDSLGFVDACKFAGRAGFLLKRVPRYGRHEAIAWVEAKRRVVPKKKLQKKALRSVNDIHTQMRRNLIVHISQSILTWFSTADGVAYTTRHPVSPVDGTPRDDSLNARETRQLARYLSQQPIVARCWREALDFFDEEFITNWSHPIFDCLARVITYMAADLFPQVRACGVHGNLRRYRFPDIIYRRLDGGDGLTSNVSLPTGLQGRRCYNRQFPGLGGRRRQYRWVEALEPGFVPDVFGPGLADEFGRPPGPMPDEPESDHDDD